MSAAALPRGLLIAAVAAISLLIGLWFTFRHVEEAARAGQKQADRYAVELVQHEQEIADLKRAAAIERRRVTITEERNDALSSQLADARLRVAAHIQRMRDQADRGDEQGSDLPGLSGGAGRADDTGSHALISRQDIDICAENSIRLANAQGWLREQQGVKQ